MSAEGARVRAYQKSRMSPLQRSRPAERRRGLSATGTPSTKGPGTLVYLECLDLDLLGQVTRRLEGWARPRGWRVTVSHVTLHPENSAPTPTRFPFHDPLAWGVLGHELEWIEAHRRDLGFFGEPPAGTLHLQCSGWLRTLACLRARGLMSQAEDLEGVGAELPCPDQTFMLVGPFFQNDLALDSDGGWSDLARAFQTKVASELESAAVDLLGARLVEGNPGWRADHYGLQIESLLARAL